MAQVASAAVNNAEWCDAVCRSHGLAGTFRSDAWTSTTRTPPLYPDAVTLAPTVAATDLLSRIDTAAGCSVKDSFATLDLACHGFEVLFDAQWYERAPSCAPAEGASAWEPVLDEEALIRWEDAWRGDDKAPRTFLPALLHDPATTILGERKGGEFVAGAIVNRSEVVAGLSNVFHHERSDEAWAGCVTAATTLHPDLPIVGYGTPVEVAAAARHGFVAIGGLRVWMKPA